MTEHPTAAALRLFLAGRLPREEARGIARHLMPGCERCGAEVAALASFLRATEAGKLPPAPEPVADVYEAPLQRAFAAVRLHGTRLPGIKKKTARALALFEKRGLTGPSARQQGDVPVYEAALARCQALRHEDPQAMIHHALMALQISRRLDRNGYTSRAPTSRRAPWASSRMPTGWRIATGMPRTTWARRSGGRRWERVTCSSTSGSRI